MLGFTIDMVVRKSTKEIYLLKIEILQMTEMIKKIQMKVLSLNDISGLSSETI